MQVSFILFIYLKVNLRYYNYIISKFCDFMFIFVGLGFVKEFFVSKNIR